MPSVVCIFDASFTLGLCLHPPMAFLDSPSSFVLWCGSPPSIFSPLSEASTTNFCLILRSYFLEVYREHETAFCNLPLFPVVNLFSKMCFSSVGDGASPSSLQDVANPVQGFTFRALPMRKKCLFGPKVWGILFGSLLANLVAIRPSFQMA